MNSAGEEQQSTPSMSVRRVMLMGQMVIQQLGGAAQDQKCTVKKSIYNKEKWLPLSQGTDFMISHYCCNVMKKAPMRAYLHESHRYPFIGTMTTESRLREQAWIRHGCNAFNGSKITSQPMSFWSEQDVLMYIFQNDLEIASVYGGIVALDKYGFPFVPQKWQCQNKLMCTGCQRTGCMFCGFGFHLEDKDNKTRFQRLAETHPKQYEYCLGGGQYVENPAYDPFAPKYDGDWLNWNPKKIWTPSKEGLGMKKVFDECNAIYGKDFMRYE